MNRKRRRHRGLRIGLTITGSLLAVIYVYLVFPLWGFPFNASRHGNPPLTPAWALECWLWEDDSNTAERVDELLEGYARHDIPVRTIMLDSPWSKRLNDFEIDTVLYPIPESWFRKLEENGYRVVLWMTTMVNSYSKDPGMPESASWHHEAAWKGFLIPGKKEISWWKGRGGSIDYSHPGAMQWWRGMQQEVFDLGIDGWKLDGTATLVRNNLGKVPLLYFNTHGGTMTTRSYMDHYYREEYAHGLKHNPEFVTLSRAMDRRFHPEGFAPLDAAPVTWVGDQEHRWGRKGGQGLESAIGSVLRSAKKGYTVVGSDVAGFSGDTIPPRLYIRWAQFSTFCGLFLNGGHGERALWKRSPEELDVIREFSWLHTELLPYIYSHVVEAHRGGPVLQQPVRGKYHYMFGDHLLVAPIYRDDPAREIRLPEGSWRYWFDDREVITGPALFTKEFPLDEYPVFIREGAIVPMNIESAYTGIGDQSSGGYLTILIFPGGRNHFTLHHPGIGGTTLIDVEETEETIAVNLDGIKKPHILRIDCQSAPQGVKLDGMSLSDPADFHYEPELHKLIIKTDNYSNGKYLIHK